MIAAHAVLAHAETSGSLSFFFTRPLEKPRTECGCQPVLATTSSMLDAGLPLKRLDHQILFALPSRCLLLDLT